MSKKLRKAAQKGLELEALEQAEPTGSFRDHCANTITTSMNDNAKERPHG